MTTVPVDLAATLDALVGGVSSVLGDGLLGAYLVGSFALGCADADSDVDVLLVTDGPLSPDADAGLAELHRRLPDRTTELGPWAAHLEVGYPPAGDLRSPVTLGRRWPYVDHGSRELVRSTHDNTAHTRWLLRQHGVALTGPPADELVAAVGADSLRAEALGTARARAEALEGDLDAYGDGWCQPYLVLTCCRLLHTAAHAEVVGKVEAARRAVADLPALAPYADLVAAAIADQPGRLARVGTPADPARADATRRLVWETVRLAGELALAGRTAD